MSELIDINIKEEEKDQESGDIYYTVEAQILEPGGVFEDGDMREDIKDKFKKVFLP